MTEKRTYKRYPKEFKEEAVALVREQGYTVTEAAEAVGVSATPLHKWKAKLYQSGKLTGQLYPSSRAHLSDSFRAIQKAIPCSTDFGNDIVVIGKRLVG